MNNANDIFLRGVQILVLESHTVRRNDRSRERPRRSRTVALAIFFEGRMFVKCILKYLYFIMATVS
jgi:hypothetical protein